MVAGNLHEQSQRERWTESLFAIQSHERWPALIAFVTLCILMCAYYVLRPVRDAMASDWTDAEVSFLWTLNFFVSTAAVAVYGLALRRIAPRKMVLLVYGLFAISFLAMSILQFEWTQHPVVIDQTFYVWVSVFSVFHISVFWSYMADLFNKQQATRLFALIGAGASAGALIGPVVPALFAERMGVHWMLVGASSLLLACIPLLALLGRLVNQNSISELGGAPGALGGGGLSGFRDFFRSPHLMGIGAFVVLYTAVGTFVYFEQKNLLAAFDLERRSRILAAIDWIVNILTFAVAFFATGRLVKFAGMPVALSCVPLLITGGLIGLAIIPSFVIVVAVQIVRRAGNYAITRPSREMLFTQVSRDQRFKAKPVIDVVCYRGGDMVTSWAFALLSQGLGLGLAAMAACGAAIAAVWSAIAIALGRRFEAN